ncbi:MAG: hypothetical protein LIO62_02510 [Clostridiales bacterium]|nr:hypothetical protein [Clostridiales bacterium]
MKTSQKMTTAKLKRGVSFFLAMIMLFSVIPVQAITVQAEVKTTAFSQISSSKVMKTHTITTGKTIPYTSTDLKTRGTQNKPSKTAYISGSDDLYVYKVGTDSKGKLYAKVSYPVGKTRYYAYIPLSAITSSNSTHKKTTATGKASTYLRSNGSGGSSSMYITKGDTVYLIATSGSYYQIMYNLSGNKAWRLAWITKSNYNKYCTDSSSSKTNTNTNTKTNSITVKGYIS